jgi:uncharacterized delta-60 repeat protein
MARRTRYLVLTTVLALAPAAAWARAGSLDPSFGTGGVASTPTPAFDLYSTIAIQPDGRIVAAGLSGDFVGPTGPALVRYLSDGSLDPSFGTGGMVSAPPVPDFDASSRVLVQPDGKLVLVGLTFPSVPPFRYGTVVARYDEDGALDPTFGTGGSVTFDSSAGSFVASDAALDPDGKLVVAGALWRSRDLDPLATDDVLLIRLTDTGAPDPAFGTGGIVASDPTAGDEGATALVLQPDGDIVIAGSRDPSGDDFSSDFLLARYDSGGTLDPTFGTGGVVVTDLGSPDDAVGDLLRQPDGKLVAVGVGSPADSLDFALARYDAGGTLDPSFGTAGVVITPVTDLTDVTGRALLDPDGKILVGGNAGRTSGADLVLVSYRPDGGLDGSFGTGGVSLTSLGPAFQGITAVARAADGKLVAAGFFDDAGGGRDAFVARFGPGACTAAPRASCKTPAVAGKSVLKLRDRPLDRSDSLTWSWSKGGATTLADLGDPLTTTAWALCLYDGAGVLVFEATAPAAGTCGTKPCWRATKSGFRRKDRTGAAEGLRAHVLKAGDAGKAKATVRGKGEQLGPPGLPLPLPLRAQLQGSDAACFEATYSQAIRNEPGLFRAKSD